VIFAVFTPNTLKAQSISHKQIKLFTIEAPQLDTTKTIWVYLPKNYKDSEKRYPVIYMHDAQNLYDEQTAYAGEWKVDEYLDTLSSNESIIIGIEHGNEKRIDELTPYYHDTHGGGKGDSYINFIKNTLKPYVDTSYRTLSNPEHTTLFGSSLGGLISFFGVIKYPETFGKAGVFSPAFWINPEIYDLVKASEIPKSTRFYFLAGTAESETMISNQNRMVALLKAKGVLEQNIKSESIEGGEHNEAFWSQHFGDAYQWLFN
jgi:alpha-glucosidase